MIIGWHKHQKSNKETKNYILSHIALEVRSFDHDLPYTWFGGVTKFYITASNRYNKQKSEIPSSVFCKKYLLRV